MFIDTIPNRTSPPAILLRESYREGGRVKKRTLANLSKLPQRLIDGIRALIAGGTVATLEAGKQEEHGFKIVRALAHGHVAAVRGMLRKLGLDRTLQGRTQVERRVRDLVEPCSSRGSLRRDRSLLSTEHLPPKRRRPALHCQ